jgi:hypothetical protein
VATFGKYEVVTELHSTERTSVFSARAAGAREIKYAIKTFHPSTLDQDEQFWESQSFTERAKVHQRAAEAGGGHWSAVYEIGTSPAGNYYVTDFHPLSAASLVAGRVEVSAGVLYSIVRSVVAGLSELKSAAGRAHGNLTATNVLINSRGDVTVAGAALADPASANDAATAGEAGDLFALGELIHLLVLGRPFQGGRGWPLQPSREWLRLGRRQGRQWRRLCEELLSPDPASRPQGLDAVARRVRKLVPRKARPSRRLSLAVATAVVLVAAGAATLLGIRDAGARREVCAAKERWAGGLTAALAQPQRRRLMESDPDLARVVREMDRADLASFDCGRPGGRFAFNPDIRQFRKTQETLAAVRRAERGLSPLQWYQLNRAAELQGLFQARGWNRPAQHLGDRIAAARPGSPDLAEGIERFLNAMSAVLRDLPDVDEKWLKLQKTTRDLDETREPFMRAFAAHLRSAAASNVELSDAGFGSLAGMEAAAGRAEALLAVQKQIREGHYDEDRFKRDILADVRLDQVRPGDVDRYLQGIEAYRVQEDQIRQAVVELKRQAAANEKMVLAGGLDQAQATEFKDKLRFVQMGIDRFAREKFIPRDVEDGRFKEQMERVALDVATLQQFVRTQDVEEWLTGLKDELKLSSAVLTRYWQQWTDGTATTARKYATEKQQIVELQSDTRRLRDVLVAMDREMPPVPDLREENLADYAGRKREELLRRIVKDDPPINWAREMGAQKVPEAQPLQAAAGTFRQWVQDLVELGKDFPIRRRILTPDVRPDEKWAAARPDFWKDPIVQLYVEPDLARLERLRALASKPREELVETARTERREELAIHAWRLLGGPNVQPAWPMRAGELAAEAETRRRLFEMLAPLATSTDEQMRADVAAAGKELADEAPRRWRRFAEAAGADDAMLASAFELREAFGVGAQEFAALAPAARFNLSLLEIRRRSGDASDEALRPVVASLTAAARELKDPAVARELAARLARIDEKEPFADAARGGEFVLKPQGTDAPIVFKRIKPQGRRPFFLATTELSFAQWSAIVSEHSAWDDLLPLVWSPQPGEIGDPRRGPRVWEWVLRPAPQMYPAQYWYAPDDANAFPKALRDPRVGKFNATVLGESAGGMPSDRHPVQYVPPEAAMYVAGLAGCRLPTPAEWRTAYEAFEKGVAGGRWNLRDQAWEAQRDSVATAAPPAGGNLNGHGPRFPDEGAYLPPTPRPATGAAAKAYPQRDGTLFFRAVDGPGGTTFRQLVGNVAEMVCEASEPFEQLPDRQPQRVKAFAADAAAGLYVVGGSALSPPEMPVDQPMPIKAGEAHADVGFRLAFTAPSRNLAEKLEWVLAGQGFVQPGADNKTARAEKVPPQS